MEPRIEVVVAIGVLLIFYALWRTIENPYPDLDDSDEFEQISKIDANLDDIIVNGRKLRETLRKEGYNYESGNIEIGTLKTNYQYAGWCMYMRKRDGDIRRFELVCGVWVEASQSKDVSDDIVWWP